MHTYNLSFDVIGVSKTWNSIQNEILDNISINGHSYYEKKSASQNGRVGYMLRTLWYVSLCLKSFDCNCYEIVWVKLDNKKARNLLIGCIYKHPTMSAKSTWNACTVLRIFYPCPVSEALTRV